MPISLTDDTTARELPPIFHGDDLYDFIMEEIEPELMGKNLPRVKELTKNETEEERTARAQRYAKAFAAYDERLKDHVEQWNDAMHVYEQNSLRMAEHIVSASEAKELSALESAMDTDA